MMITEIINQLQELKEKHGDLPVYTEHSEHDMPPKCGYGMGIQKIRPYEGKGFKKHLIIESGYYHTQCSNLCSNCKDK